MTAAVLTAVRTKTPEMVDVPAEPSPHGRVRSTSTNMSNDNDDPPKSSLRDPAVPGGEGRSCRVRVTVSVTAAGSFVQLTRTTPGDRFGADASPLYCPKLNTAAVTEQVAASSGATAKSAAVHPRSFASSVRAIEFDIRMNPGEVSRDPMRRRELEDDTRCRRRAR